MAGHHQRRGRGIRGNAAHTRTGLGQRLPDRAPGGAEIVADINGVGPRGPDPLRRCRVERNRIDRRVAQALSAALPLPAAVLARHDLAVDDRKQEFGGLARHRERGDLGALRQCARHPVIALPAVVAREQASSAQEVDPAGHLADRKPPRRRGTSRSVGPKPLPILIAKHAARGGADRALAVRREGKREHGADDLTLAFGRPAATPGPRAHQTEISPQQQVVGVARVDRDGERGVEEQPDIRVQPRAPEVARAEQPAIRARVMRARASARQHQGACQRRDDATRHARSAPLLSKICGEPVARLPAASPTADPAHFLRDFSPEASAISAMREPLADVHEFLVSGYLSV